jgi:hypothetical protein
MREIRTSGSEGGAGRKPRSYLYQDFHFMLLSRHHTIKTRILTRLAFLFALALLPAYA